MFFCRRDWYLPLSLSISLIYLSYIFTSVEASQYLMRISTDGSVYCRTSTFVSWLSGEKVPQKYTSDGMTSSRQNQKAIPRIVRCKNLFQDLCMCFYYILESIRITHMKSKNKDFANVSYSYFLFISIFQYKMQLTQQFLYPFPSNTHYVQTF